jgi:hypothetical protein
VSDKKFWAIPLFGKGRGRRECCFYVPWTLMVRVIKRFISSDFCFVMGLEEWDLVLW